MPDIEVYVKDVSIRSMEEPSSSGKSNTGDVK